MLGIAFQENEGLFYEGHMGYGRIVSPSPVLTIATILKNPEDVKAIPATHTLATQFVFREDSFDPVTRVRRGRMYKWPEGQAQPHAWQVYPNPSHGPREAQDANNNGGRLNKTLYGWRAWQAFAELGGPNSRVLVALGIQEAFTLWRVVDIERIVTGEDLITLRARGALGVLPELNAGAIPVDGREKVFETVDKLSAGAYRAGPEAIVDLARGAAQWCLGVWLADKKGNAELRQKDLGALAKMLEDTREKDIAMLVGRFHSRAKPNEQERLASRPITEEDAEFALASIGLLLRELGWAKT
jgi:hypothetical protein